MRVGLGGLLTPDGCIEEVAVPGMVAHQRYRLRSLAFTPPGSGTLWCRGGGHSVGRCAHNGGRVCGCWLALGWSEASAERNPLLGVKERECV